MIKFEKFKNYIGEIEKHFVIWWMIYRLKNGGFNKFYLSKIILNLIIWW